MYKYTYVYNVYLYVIYINIQIIQLPILFMVLFRKNSGTARPVIAEYELDTGRSEDIDKVLAVFRIGFILIRIRGNFNSVNLVFPIKCFAMFL